MKYLIFFLLPFFLYSQNFIQIEKDLVNIRFDADQNSQKVGQAEFGQIFLSNASTKKWAPECKRIAPDCTNISGTIYLKCY